MRTVMIADDEQLIIKGYKKLFDWNAYGYEIVAEAMDGEEAVEKAKLFRPDIILIDINMPKMNGLQAIKEIKSLFSDIDIIIISGYDDFLLVREALLLQVADYLLKPINFEELVICLAKIEDRRNDGSILLDNKAMLTDFPHPEKNEMKTIDKMLEFIDENISEPELSLKIIASEFHMNPYYISSFFKKKTDTNFLEYVNLRRVQIAKNLLDQTDLTIGEIAEKVGISDYRSFSKMFRKHVGLQPSQYRSESKR